MKASNSPNSPNGANSPKSFGERLEWALTRYAGQRSELATTCGVSRAAANKWFLGEVQDLASRNLFLVARECRVNPEWLSLGEGPATMARPREVIPQFSPVQMEILEALAKLPRAVEIQFRALLTAIIVNA